MPSRSQTGITSASRWRLSRLYSFCTLTNRRPILLARERVGLLDLAGVKFEIPIDEHLALRTSSLIAPSVSAIGVTPSGS